MRQVKIGTVTYEDASDGVARSGYVLFSGTWIVDTDNLSALMLWDASIGNVRAMTAPEITAFRAALLTAKAQSAKAAATTSVDNGQAQPGTQFERLSVAAAQVALDAVNNDRTVVTAMNGAVQAAASLADLKVRFAAINFMPQVTMAQLAGAIKAKIAATAE